MRGLLISQSVFVVPLRGRVRQVTATKFDDNTEPVEGALAEVRFHPDDLLPHFGSMRPMSSGLVA